MKNLLVATLATTGMWLATPAWADPFFFSAGEPDGLLGAFSQPAVTGHLETETADDFVLTQTTSITQATVTGLVRKETALDSVSNVEVEIYHVFPTDSADPPSGNVPARANSPGDVEIATATRDASLGTLSFSTSVVDESFSVANTVADGIKPKPDNMTLGDGPADGEAVQITITFTRPIILRADHYFFRPEVQVPGGFLYLSAPKPITAPGTPFMGDLQAWIRNSALAPDWLRIGTDIIGGDPVHTFNMAFTLTGETIGEDPTPTPTATPTSTATAIDTATPTRTAVATSTATSQPTQTATDPMSNNSGGCNLGDAASTSSGTIWLLLSPAMMLWFRRRPRA